MACQNVGFVVVVAGLREVESEVFGGVNGGFDDGELLVVVAVNADCLFEVRACNPFDFGFGIDLNVQEGRNVFLAWLDSDAGD